MTEGSRSRWGRIADDGTVYVRTSAGERAVGSWRAGTPEEGLAHFARRFDDLEAEVALLEKRVANPAVDPRGLASSAERLRTGLPDAAVVGDLDALETRLTALDERVRARLAEREAEREQQAAKAVDAKVALAEEAERLAKSTEWKTTGDRLRAIGEDWRAVTGVDRKTDQALWKRVVAAREEFGRRRSAHFAALEAQRSVSKGRKEKLIAEAESLRESTDWGPTAGRFKAMMTEWKAAGRAARDVDDQLWVRFKAAQDAFFGRRAAVNAERDAEYRENQTRKEALLAEAEALDPATDVAGAQRRLRQIQERWESVGRVPREVMGTLEKRLAAVETRVRAAADSRWRQTAEEIESPLVVRLRESVAKLEARAAKAREAGRDKDAADIEETLATQRQWLAQAESSQRR